MVVFDRDYVSKPSAERLREAGVWAVVIAVTAGFIGLSWWLEALKVPTSQFMFPAMLMAYGADYGLSRPRAVAWLERGRSVKAGEWRTARAVRLKTVVWGLLVAGYAWKFAVQARYAWMVGDMPRFAAATVMTVAVLGFVVWIATWRTQAVVELSITEAGIFLREWKGVVPWGAVDFVVPSGNPDRAVRLVLEAERLSDLPEFVRRRNGSLELNLASTALSSAAAVDALRAACPDLEVRRPRSGGLVLPVRGATDIVEPDL